MSEQNALKRKVIFQILNETVEKINQILAPILVEDNKMTLKALNEYSFCSKKSKEKANECQNYLKLEVERIRKIEGLVETETSYLYDCLNKNYLKFDAVDQDFKSELLKCVFNFEKSFSQKVKREERAFNYIKEMK